MNTWKRFSEKRPVPGEEITIDCDGIVLGPCKVLAENHTLFEDLRTGNKLTLCPTYKWKSIGVYEKPASRASNPNHPNYETKEAFNERVNGEPEFAPKRLAENPKDVIGSKKLPFSTLPWAVLAEAAAGMGEGAIKYGKHNYEVVGIRNSIYFDATLRHLIAWFLGEDIDPESGVHHVTKAITSLLVLRDAQLYDNATDDRPVAPPADHLQAAKDLFSSLTKDLTDCRKHYDRESIKNRQRSSDEGRNNEY